MKDKKKEKMIAEDIKVEPFKKSDTDKVLPVKLTGNSRFKFSCHKGGKCFTACCSNINIVLPPYDLLRLRKGLGMTAVVAEDRRMLGLISDGDLRRFFQREGNQALGMSAADCMTRTPVTIGRKELATRALSLMESRKITGLLVVNAAGKLEGVVHIHDLWGTQMF